MSEMKPIQKRPTCVCGTCKKKSTPTNAYYATLAASRIAFWLAMVAITYLMVKCNTGGL